MLQSSSYTPNPNPMCHILFNSICLPWVSLNPRSKVRHDAPRRKSLTPNGF
ncbi:mCG148280 [Mus musculus]|nr:mCG148280 [Mus musculus]